MEAYHRARAGRGNQFHFEVAGDLLDDRSVELLNQAPSRLIQLEMVFKASILMFLRGQSKTDLDRLARQVKVLRQGAGSSPFGSDCRPAWETLEAFGRSFDFVWALEVDHFQLVSSSMPGSPMVDQPVCEAFSGRMSRLMKFWPQTV